jgi:hypothetical protein
MIQPNLDIALASEDNVNDVASDEMDVRSLGSYLYWLNNECLC